MGEEAAVVAGAGASEAVALAFEGGEGDGAVAVVVVAMVVVVVEASVWSGLRGASAGRAGAGPAGGSTRRLRVRELCVWCSFGTIDPPPPFFF